MDWWQHMKLNRPLENSLGIPDTVLDKLAHSLDRYQRLRHDLPEYLIRYVVDGEEETVVQDLKTLHHVSYIPWGGNSEFDFIKKQQLDSPQFYRRMIEIYDAESSSFGLNAFGDDDLLRKIGFFIYLLPFCRRYQARLFEQILENEGYPTGSFVHFIFSLDPKRYPDKSIIEYSIELKGFRELCLEYPESIIEVLRSAASYRRVHMLTVIHKLKVSVVPFIDTLIPLVASSAKSVRDAAAKIIKREPELFIPRLKGLAQAEKTEERYRAIQLLWDLQGDEITEFLQVRQQEETSDKVLSLLQQLSVSPVEQDQQQDRLSLPPLPAVDLNAALSPDLLAGLQLFVDRCNQVTEQKKESLLKLLIKNRHQQHELRYPQLRWLSGLFDGGDTIPDFVARHPKYSDLKLEHALREKLENDQKVLSKDDIAGRLESGSVDECRDQLDWMLKSQVREYQPPLFRLLQYPDLQPVQMIRLMLMMSDYSDDPLQSPAVLHYLKHHSETVGLRELSAAAAAIGASCKGLGSCLFWSAYLKDSVYGSLSKDAIWPYFVERLNKLEKQFHGHHRREALELLTCFPSPPPSLIPMLWEIALGSAKLDRALAQTCLDSFPSTEDRLILSLEDSRGEIRAIAAEWLANRESDTAVDPIRVALKKEKSEAAKDAMLRSLERLGVAVDEFLDRSLLLKEAKQGLKKGVPSPISDWFPFDFLPVVRWADTQAVVAPEILTWFIVKSYKQKSLEPGPILRRYVSQFDPAGRQALGQLILESWIAQDTQRLSEPDEEDEYYFVQYGSAIKEKGILALAAACCGSEAVPVVERYLKEWYGLRAAQCKALLQMLAWIDDNSAIQVLLAVANRFRTRSIQKEAQLQVDQLAQRRGWTRSELADRTIPTAGFDRKGLMILDYGERQFQASIDPKFNVILIDPQGKQIKSLPEARKQEDTDQIKALKKHFTASKKQIKQVLKLQTEKLYEAMCTQRTWIFQDWEQFLHCHPIVGRLCQRLIWSVVTSDRVIQTFRPLEDGTLTDVADQQVTVGPKERIGLAHTCTLAADQVQSWRDHVSDYEVEPLFEQFPQEIYDLDGDSSDTEIRMYEGYLLEAFQLRGIMTKRGYMRGLAEDGGYFYTYHKTFSDLGLMAMLEFSGNSLPEDNHQVALIGLRFYKTGQGQREELAYESGGAMALSQIPRVLLTEVWTDLKIAASQGTGYDPAWEQTVR